MCGVHKAIKVGRRIGRLKRALGTKGTCKYNITRNKASIICLFLLLGKGINHMLAFGKVHVRISAALNCQYSTLALITNAGSSFTVSIPMPVRIEFEC